MYVWLRTSYETMINTGGRMDKKKMKKKPSNLMNMYLQRNENIEYKK